MLNLGLGLLRLILLVSSFLDATGYGGPDIYYSYGRSDFPPGFVFGSGTSAYQVEGAANEDGRTPSIWDTYTHSGDGPGGNGDVACDGYHKYKEDVKLMVDIGLEAYRFSISWSRLIPNGRGPINPKGLEYYNNLINELINHGIQPHVTLFNYDLPQSLEDEYGGWISPKIVEDFTAYAEVCFKEFGDRVSYWTTVNEPNVFAQGGYDLGFTPPQRCSPPFGKTNHNCSQGNSTTEPYLVVHHSLLAHASTSTLYKKNYQDKQHGFIGFSLYTARYVPFTDSKEDAYAAQRATQFLMSWVLHPLVFGEYPKLMKKIVGSRMPIFTKEEKKLMKGSCDFIGIIYYYKYHVSDDPHTRILQTRDYLADLGVQLTKKEDVNSPEGLQEVIEYLNQVYGNLPMYIYENGLAMKRNSSLEDVARVEYMQSHIAAVLDVLRNGSNIKGYFTWSLFDVYELLYGYNVGYGLFYVDLDDPNFKRYPKLSSKWYSNFLKPRWSTTYASSK